jgi:hypothetical protein
MIRDLINLATLNAFDVDPSDTAYPLANRVPGKKIALLNWGPNAIKIGFALRGANGFVVADEQLVLPSTTSIPKIVEALEARTDCGCLALLYSAVNLFCEAQNGPTLTRGEDLENKLRTNPKEIIGPSFEEDRIYQLLLAPDNHTRIVFAINRAPFAELEKALTLDGELKIVRAQLGAYAALNAVLADPGWGATLDDRIELPVVINQAQVIVAGYDGMHFWPDVFRASPLFWERSTESPEFAEEVRSFFLNCAESTVLNRKVLGKQVLFRILNVGTSPEAASRLEHYLEDRAEVAFEPWMDGEVNLDFKSLLGS